MRVAAWRVWAAMGRGMARPRALLGLKGLVLVLALGMASPLAAYQALPSFEQVRARHGSSYGRILDRHGDPLSEIRLDPRNRRLEWMALQGLSPAMLEALLAAEDRRFYQHGGVDWRAVAAAVWQNLWYDRTRGASTLSMQLAGLLDPELQLNAGEGGRRTLGQKWDQALAARDLEASWSKEQILEAYLNLAPFRGDTVGVPAAAWGLFRKGPATLDRAEAAVLAVLLRGPNAAPGLVARRACTLLRKLRASQACDEATTLSAQLASARSDPRWDLAPQAARRLLRQSGESLHTTLDRGVQTRAREMMAGVAGSLLVVDNATGGVLAYTADSGDVGQVDEAFRAPFARPLRWGWDIGQRKLTAANLLVLESRPGAWVSVRTAVATGGAVSGLEASGPPDPSWPFGPEPLGLVRLAGRYRALARGGEAVDPTWIISRAAGPLPLLGPEAAYIVTDSLTPLGAGPAVMTADADGRALCVAVNANATLALVLEGTAEEARNRAKALLAQIEPPTSSPMPWPPHPPAGLVRRHVLFTPPVELPRWEWFLAGSELRVATSPMLPGRIVRPADRSILDLRKPPPDFDFRFTFEAQAAGDLIWRVDGIEIGRGREVSWVARPGHATIELQDAEGRLLDTVHVLVRIE
ncbi:MAG: transglycosylase domain-containing protein [Zoogloeaceae bacterium]|nr:transglycosylase domain-containing protein [Zoogloeaceae bacterium]